jgi:porin
MLIAELAYTYNQDQRGASQENPHQEGSRVRTSVQQSSAARPTASGLPGTVKLGAWVHTGSFADQRFNARGGLLAASSANPLQHAGNFAVYGVIEQMLWRADGSGGDHGLNFFLRASAAPRDRNPVNLYFDTGLTFKGPIASRPDDTVGIGFAFGRISPQAGASDRDLVTLTGTPMPIRDYEAAIELTYPSAINPGLVAAAGSPIYHPPWRSRTQFARAGHLVDPECHGHRRAVDPEILEQQR